METLEQMISLAHALKDVTQCRDAYELRAAVEEWGGFPDDVVITIDGEEWRFISDNAIDEIMADELEADPYILGCFNADFIASVAPFPVEMVEACQKAEAYEALGNALIDGDYVRGPHGMAQEYARADGYGHHFSSYDGNGHEFTWDGRLHHAFRVG